MSDDGVVDHGFAPLVFHDANGQNPIETDWCGRLVVPQVCGQLASAHRPVDSPAGRGPDLAGRLNREADAAVWLIEGLVRRFVRELTWDPLVSCAPGSGAAIELLAERLAAAAYGVITGRPHPLAGLLEQIRLAAPGELSEPDAATSH